MLKRYEAAWEALDFDALTRVWMMPDPRGMRARLRDYREYAMDVSVESITVGRDARSATARCTVIHRFQAVGGRQEHTLKQTFRFEKRGENWIIVEVS